MVHSIDGQTDCRKKPTGFVLLVVIAVLTATLTALSLLASATLSRGEASADGVHRLQQDWAIWSIRVTVLDRAATIFKARDEANQAASSLVDQPRIATDDDEPPPWIAETLQLSGVRYDLRIDDENAKVDLNQMYHGGSATDVQRWLDSRVGQPAAIRLQPSVPPQPRTANEPRLDDASTDEEVGEDTSGEDGSGDGFTPRLRAFRSWGEVFDLPSLQQSGGRDALPAIATDITITGGGGTNITRASDDAILAAASTVLRENRAKQLLKRYRRNPNMAIESLLQSEVSDPRQRRELAKLFSRTSDSFSLWIDCRGRDRPRRIWFVSRTIAEGGTQREMFSF